MDSLRVTFPNLYLLKKLGADIAKVEMTTYFLTTQLASLLPRWVIDIFIWLPKNY